MAGTRTRVSFLEREFRGSRFRCLLVTSMAQPRVIEWLHSLVQPIASVREADRYMPMGFCRPDEAKLGETSEYLDDQLREALMSWWLVVREKANTPNWDIVSTCTVGERKGLILVEAKAYDSEIKTNDCCGAKNLENRQRIGQAIGEANAALGTGWSLSAERCYQISNRFAWAWKIASSGVPVVLVYLGFLNASEMGKTAFATPEQWKQSLLTCAKDCVPTHAWDTTIDINGVPLIPLVRSSEVNVRVT